MAPNEDEPALVAVTVAPPGDAPFGYEGFEAGEEPLFWIGGDAFIADAIRVTTDDPSSLVTTGCGADLDLFN